MKFRPLLFLYVLMQISFLFLRKFWCYLEELLKWVSHCGKQDNIVDSFKAELMTNSIICCRVWARIVILAKMFELWQRKK